jgi:hypothetical protein
MLGHALLVDVALLAHPPFNIVPIEGHVPSPVKSPTIS